MLKNWIKRSFIVGMGFCLMTPVVSHAFGEASVIQSYVGGSTLIPLIKPSWGNFVLHADVLNKLYQVRGYRAIWVDSNGKPTDMAGMLKAILLTAQRHGLNPADYWDGDVENLYKAALANPKNWITFELAASEALIRYVTHMSVGRFDPMSIDDDIKFQQKSFNEFMQLDAAVSYGAQSMPGELEKFAPNYKTYYADMMEMLRKLRKLKDAGGWPTLPDPGVVLKPNVKHPLIAKLRTRLKNLNYNVSDNGSDLYDADFEAAIKEFQANNGMDKDGIIGSKNSEVLRGLNATVDQRITQVEVNMERLRWLPRTMENKHVFVDLGMTEVRIYEQDNTLKFFFNSVNGQPFRRTPSMRDSIRYVNLNPYWTAPRSITIKDKLKELRTHGRSYLDKNGMMLINEENGQVVSDWELDYIDWKNLTPKNFNYYIKQKPSVKNALGVVKFPLQNEWAIYLHDTNAPELFAEKERHQSSGCVRLEQAKDLALYLIDGQTSKHKSEFSKRVYTFSWNKETLDDVLARDRRPGDWEDRTMMSQELWDISVHLKEPVPVYMLYLTAKLTDGGAMRFVDDVYGQDKRIEMAIKNSRKKAEIF